MADRDGCCSGEEALRMVFACSGAADTGEIADRAARKLSRGGNGSFVCLALVGAGNRGLVLSAEGAEAVLAIDGCPTDCARKMLEATGMSGFRHLRVTDLEMEKGKSPATEERIDRVVAEGRNRLGS
jgi:uncharacterized metal-binding protein